MATISTIQTIGKDKGIVLTQEMIAHLGVSDQVEVRFETGRLVLSLPSGLQPGPNRKSFEDAMNSTFERYDEALRRLATVPDGCADKE